MERFGRVHPDDVSVCDLIDRHHAEMRSQTPPESCHVLSPTGLSAPDIRLYALFEGEEAIAIGALRITGVRAELKSMHVARTRRGCGAGRRMLVYLMQQASRRGVQEIALETGAGPEHLAARTLYRSEGFNPCGPFGAYRADPLSCFLSRKVV